MFLVTRLNCIGVWNMLLGMNACTQDYRLLVWPTRSLRATAGVMISASHNPYEDNGIKFFFNDGYKLSDAIEGEIERLIDSGEVDNIRPTAQMVGKAFRMETAVGRYMEFAKASFPREMNLDGLKIVVDCANGAAYKVGPEFLPN